MITTEVIAEYLGRFVEFFGPTKRQVYTRTSAKFSGMILLAVGSEKTVEFDQLVTGDKGKGANFASRIIDFFSGDEARWYGAEYSWQR